MKKQMLIGIGLASTFVLVGCETPQPQPQEVVSYSSTTYQNGTQKVDYAVRPGDMAKPAVAEVQPQPQPRYLLEPQQPAPVQTPAPAAEVQQVAVAPAPAPAAAPAPVATPAPVPAPVAVQENTQMQVQQAAPVQQVVVQKQRPRQERIKITGVGYGAESVYEGFTVGQKRLMAIRASKLDAYRALAEQLYGIKIDSNTSVSTMTAQSDSFRARVNAVVKGARIVSITPMSDNNYETVLEVFVDRSFFEDVFVYTGNQHDRVLEPIETCTLGFNCYEAASYR